MKLKGVKPIEQHFEKLIVAALSVVFLVVLLMQFVMQPNMVEVGNPKQPRRPGREAYTPIQQQSDKLKIAINEPDPALPEVEKVEIVSSYRESLTGGVSPRMTLATGIDGRPVVGGTMTGEVSTGSRYVEFRPNAPTNLVAGFVMNTISPLTVQAMPELAAYLPEEQPYDKTVVTIEGVFDGTALRSLLESDPDGEGELMPLRSNWWRNKIQILAVRLEREELTATGEWTNLTLVDQIPGPAAGLLADLPRRAANTRALEALAASVARSTAQERILRPTYYPTIAGEEWLPPIDLAEAREGGANQGAIDILLSRLSQAEKALERIEETKTQRETEAGRPLRNFERQMERKEAEIEQLQDELRDLGHVFEDDELNEVQQTRFGRDEETTPLLEDDAIRLWAHDLTATPGATYRYRMSVVTNNPAFGRQAVLDDDQKRLAASQLSQGEMSEWTEPIDVPGMEYFFVTSASAGGQGALSGVKASVEVFKFYYGFWRKGSVGVQPGDLIVADVSVPEELYTFDFGEAPKDNDGMVLADALKPLEVDQDGNKEDPPQWWVETPTRIHTEPNAQFLDVTRIPSDGGGGLGGVSARPKYQAVLNGGRFSRLFMRRPTEDKGSALYQQLTASARLGLTQGQPEVKDEKRQDLLDNQRKENQFPSAEEEGGGGGG